VNKFCSSVYHIRAFAHHDHHHSEQDSEQTAVQAQALVPAKPVAPAVQPVREQQPTEPPIATYAGGELKEHEMMIRGDVKVEVKKKKVLPPLKNKTAEAIENIGNVTWPTMDEMEVPNEIKAMYEDWYKIGMNRQRQKKHGDEIPSVRNPDLIITGNFF